MTTVDSIDPAAVARLRRDVREAANLSNQEARFLVDSYYTLQEHRIEAQNQVRALTASGEPNDILAWLFDQHRVLEAEIKKVLGDYADGIDAGVWAQSLLGIGPVITAGLLAHIDINRAPTVGHIWSFAGLNPDARWEKGQKRPWNASLKVLCWKIGESFVKVSGRPCLPGADPVENAEVPERAVPDESTVESERAVSLEGTESRERADSSERTGSDERAESPEGTDPTERPLPRCVEGCANYGHVYMHRKALEVARNERGDFADQAEATLASKNIGKTTDAYKAYSKGMLPPARIHARSKRYATKLFLAHFHHVLHETVLGTPPPKPYVLEHGGHAHYLGPPNWPMP